MKDHAASIASNLVRNPAQLYRVPLTPLNCSFGIATERGSAVPLKPTVKKEWKVSKAEVTVVFCVRQPGCSLCREHGAQLAPLADGNVSLVGVVQDVAYDCEALLDFYSDFFRYPIYKDHKWKIYNLLGSRKLSFLDILKKVPTAYKRVKFKKIRSRSVMKGDFFTQGGVLVFDKNENLVFTMLEEFGKEFDMDAIRLAIKEARNRSDATTNTSDSLDSQSLSIEHATLVC